jgi:hypothetical protein
MLALKCQDLYPEYESKNSNIEREFQEIRCVARLYLI